MRPGAPGIREKIVFFSLSWELGSDLCDDVQCGAHVELNRDGGDNDCLV